MVDATAALANTFTRRQVSVEQVENGFVITGQTSYVDNDTKGIVASQSARAVFNDVGLIGNAVGNYMNSGQF